MSERYLVIPVESFFDSTIRVEEILEALNRIPEEYRKSAELEFEEFDGDVETLLTYTRPETEEEANKRTALYSEIEREEYERLKAKFGDKNA